MKAKDTAIKQTPSATAGAAPKPKKQNFFRWFLELKWYRKLSLTLPLVVAVASILSKDAEVKMLFLGVQLGLIINMMLELLDWNDREKEHFKEWTDLVLENLKIRLDVVAAEARYKVLAETVQAKYGVDPSTLINTQRVHQARKNKQVPRRQAEKRDDTTRRVGSKKTTHAARKDR